MAESVSRRLTRARVEVLRIELQSELVQLRRNLRQEWPSNVPSASDWICGGSRAGRADQVESEAHERMRARCAQIAVALDHIRRGVYGRCSRCKREIPYERLVLDPVASTCQTCNILDSWLRPDVN